MAFRMAVCLTLAAETTSFLTAEAAGRLAGATGFFAGKSTSFLAAGAVVDPAGSFTEGAAGSGIAGEIGAAATGAAGPCTPAAAGFDWFGRSRRRTAASTDLTPCITSPLAARTTRPNRSEETEIEDIESRYRRGRNGTQRTTDERRVRGYALAALVCCFLRSAQ